jgi:hypothetical protein
MDMDTFLTTLYVLVDDWYKETIAAEQRPKAGAAVTMSDSEVLTVALAGQWRVGVPWQSERGVVRYMQAHGRGWFPTMLERSAFNQRVRNLCGLFIRLQQAVEAWLKSPDEVYQGLDSVPLIAFSNSHALRAKQHWLQESTLGHGGTHGGWFYGDHLLLSVQRHGAVSGWLVGAAHINDRWLVEAFLSARAGQPQVQGPRPNPHEARRNRPALPIGHLGGWIGVGAWTAQAYLADRGMNGRRWRHAYRAEVVAIPLATTLNTSAGRVEISSGTPIIAKWWIPPLPSSTLCSTLSIYRRIHAGGSTRALPLKRRLTILAYSLTACSVVRSARWRPSFVDTGQAF